MAWRELLLAGALVLAISIALAIAVPPLLERLLTWLMGTGDD